MSRKWWLLSGGNASYLYICYRIVENARDGEGVTRLTREASRAFLQLRRNSWESSGLAENYFCMPEGLGLGLRVMVAACRCFNKVLPNAEVYWNSAGVWCSVAHFTRFPLTNLCNKMVTFQKYHSRHKTELTRNNNRKYDKRDKME